MKKNILLFLMFILSAGLNAQSRYLWTGAVNNNWKNAGNWNLVDGVGISAGYPKDISCIALFGTSPYGTSTNVDCNIDGYYYPNGGLYVGGVEVNGYTGTITQMPGNRFLITDCPAMNGCAYNSDYKAVFNFGAGGKFVGSTLVNVAGSLNYQDNYTMAIGVKLEIISGDFYCPRKLLMENSCDIAPGCFRGEGFDGSGCVVSFYPRPTVLMSTYFINANNVDFYDLQLYTGKYLDFGAGNMNITNDLITAGSSVMHINNGTFHIKNNIVINSGDYSTYSLGTAHNPAGTAMLIMDGTIAQKIIKNTTPANETSGPLGHVTINNSNGVSITGRVNIAGSMTFVDGIITQQTPGAPDDVLIFDNPAVVIGANDNSYSEAPVRKHIYSIPTASFEFPIGKNGEYHPIIISAPTGGSGGYGSTNPAYYTQFTAEYFDTPTPYPTSTATGTYAVHDCQYWTLQRNNKPGSNAKVSLTWNSNTCNNSYFATPSDLRVAQYDGSLWQSRGVSGGIGSYSGGSKITEATGAPITQFNGALPTYFTFSLGTTPPPIFVTIPSFTNPTCNPGTDGTATASVSGAIGMISYSWNS
ncbi:MAG: SprB repeat-containing protein, partial [Bacteroidota bacterium]|nr:SprB repeat-containing protein [Bacteroidota bacterium]